MASTLFVSLIRKRFLQTFTARLSLTPPLPTSSTTASSSKSSFTVEYLISTCGLSPKSALSASTKLRLDEDNLQKPESVLQFLKTHDFSNTDIAKLIQKMPEILHRSIEDILRPKFSFLIQIGFVGRFLPDLITSDPCILRRSLDHHLKGCFELFRPFFCNDEKFVTTIIRSSWLLSGGFNGNVQANVDFLMKEGVPHNRIGKLLMLGPRNITQKRERMVAAVNTVKNLGLQPKAPMFVYGVSVLLQMSESTWRKKMEVMKSLGWSEEEILFAFKRYPNFMASSEEKIRTAMDFYTNTMKFQKQDVVAYPVFLHYSLDKRVRPRWNLLQVLKSKDMIQKDVNMKLALQMAEKMFWEKYIIKYIDKVPDILKIYEGAGRAKGCLTGKK